jgi:hypothetical protein
MAQPSIQERAASIWVDTWRLAGEKWPPASVPAAWRVYEHLKQALTGFGASEAQAIAFVDDFFNSSKTWGDLTLVDNHITVIEALTVALLDSELVGTSRL